MEKRIVFLVLDGIRGHENQSRGIALQLAREGGVEIVERTIPPLSGMSRFLALKIASRFACKKGASGAAAWLSQVGGEALLRDARSLAGRDAPLCFLGAGSGAAMFAFFLARATGARCGVIMNPSVLGVEPFDFAIAPRHDVRRPAANLFVTLGAPNLVDADRLAAEGEALAAEFPPKSSERWAILIGGDDKNYRVTPEWVRTVVGALLQGAAWQGADCYITTSRRTSEVVEATLQAMAAGNPVVRMLFLASRNPRNPVPGMLGLATAAFCTEDSVSMASEIAAAGHTVRLLRVERIGGWRGVAQRGTVALVRRKRLARERLWGAPRFDAMFAAFEREGLLLDMKTEDLAALRRGDALPSAAHEGAFNETRDAALWLLRRWDALLAQELTGKEGEGDGGRE